MYAPVHQHFFVARMDFCVDGVKNSIVEYNAEAETEGPHNPTLNGFFFKETPLVSELAAVRDLSPETARYRYILLVAFIHSCNLRFEQLFVQYMFSHTHTHMCSLSLTHTHTHTLSQSSSLPLSLSLFYFIYIHFPLPTAALISPDLQDINISFSSTEDYLCRNINLLSLKIYIKFLSLMIVTTRRHNAYPYLSFVSFQIKAGT